MKKLLLATILFLMLVPALPGAREIDYFPMDKDLAWVFDDGSVEKIVAFRKLEITMGEGREKKKNVVHLFTFENFNHEKRTFYRMGSKVYEWIDGLNRLRYDLGAREGASWEMKWGRIEQGLTSMMRNRLQSDINEGAVVTLVGKNVTVKTPMGEFANCVHFRVERPGVADAGYIEEWLAPGVGVVKRLRDTIAGPREQMLAKIVNSEPGEKKLPYRMDVRLDRETYVQGDDITIKVSVLNWSDSEITLDFPSAFQVDYTIDDEYKWSAVRDFTQALTQVVIPPRDVHKWEFIHTQQDFDIQPGKHRIVANLVGTDLTAGQGFFVVPPKKELPGGLTFDLALEKTVFGAGEPIPFTLTVTNTGDAPATLELPEKDRVWYEIDGLVREHMIERPEVSEVVIPAGESLVIEGRHNTLHFMLRPGDYTLTVGLSGYGQAAEAPFTVTNEFAYGEVKGVVVTPDPASEFSKEAERTFIPVEGAQVKLTPTVPKHYTAEFSNMPVAGKRLWAAVTDANGEFTLDNVPLGLFYTLSAAGEGLELYQETIRTLKEGAEFRIVLKPRRPHPVEPLNYKRHVTESGLAVAFGVGRTVYAPGDAFKAFMKVTNTTDETVMFTFDNDEYLSWALKDRHGDVILASDFKAQKAAAGFVVEIGPRESHLFEQEGAFSGVEKQGSYILESVLRFSSSSIEGLEPGSVKGFVKLVIASPEAQPKEPKRVKLRSNNRQMVVDFKDDLKAHIDMRMTSDEVEGEISVAEIRQNIHEKRPGRKFLKMIEVDADETIREAMEEAVVRIYYDDMDLEPDFDPQQLVIAHWHESLSSEIDSEPSWTELETKVDTVNKFVEATTTEFSSFALFAPEDVTTAVEETLPDAFVLRQNSPNPFNPSTMIEFVIPEAGQVTLTVFNIMGQEVARLVEDRLAAGSYRVVFDGSSFSSGVYFYRIETPGHTASRKMLLVK